MTRLSAANRAALAEVRARAELDRPRQMARIARVLAGVEADAEALLDAVSGKGAVTLNFHPDRLLADGRSVARALCDEGEYRSQFETGVSSGELSGYPGGNRDAWERALFGGAYQAPGVEAGERPKYGGLNLMNHLDGACPGFGSCHLRLRAAESERATLIFGDSSDGAEEIGLIDAFAPALAPLLEELAVRGELRPFVQGVLRGGLARGVGLFAPAMGHSVTYVEAQVHGPVSLSADVEAVVIDPAFADTATGDLLVEAARRYGPSAEWHAGFALPLTELPEEAPTPAAGELMRWQELCAGGRARRLATEVAERYGGARQVDAASIGEAAAAAAGDPEVSRDLKDLWVLVVRLGSAHR